MLVCSLRGGESLLFVSDCVYLLLLCMPFSALVWSNSFTVVIIVVLFWIHVIRSPSVFSSSEFSLSYVERSMDVRRCFELGPPRCTDQRWAPLAPADTRATGTSSPRCAGSSSCFSCRRVSLLSEQIAEPWRASNVLEPSTLLYRIRIL